MTNRLVAVDDANYRLPAPVLAATVGSPEFDEATATFAAGASETNKAIDAKWLNRQEYQGLMATLAAGFHPADELWAYGHSFVIGSGLTTPDYYVTKVAESFGMALTNRGVGGAKAEEAAWRMWGGTGKFTVGTKAVLLFQLMMNSMRLNGIDIPTARGVEWAWRTMAAFASGKTLWAHNSARFTDTGSWSSGTDSTYPSGGYRSSSAAGAIREFTTQTASGRTFLLALGRKVGLAAAQTEIRRMDTNEVLLLWDNVNQAAAGISQNYAPAAIRLDVPEGTVIRITVMSGTTTICGLLETDPANANPILAVKEPKLANWAASVSYPNGSDAAADYFNAIVDTVAADFPNMIVVDPAPSWRKENSATLVQADQVHPNVEGNERFCLQVLQAASRAVSAAAPRSLFGDTDWVTLTLTGFTGTLRGRRIGDDVTLVGNSVAGSVPTATLTTIATLPKGWYPSSAVVVGAAQFGTTATGIARATDAGIVGLLQASGSTQTVSHFTITYAV